MRQIERAAYTERLRADLDEVFAFGKRVIRPDSDRAVYGIADRWGPPDTRWRDDCDGFVFFWRDALLARGVPQGALVPYGAVTRAGEGHLFLGVHTTRGMFVLDNLEGRVLAAQELTHDRICRPVGALTGDWEYVTIPDLAT